MLRPLRSWNPLLLAVLLTGMPFTQDGARAQLGKKSGPKGGSRSKTFRMPDSAVRPLVRATMESLGLTVIDDPKKYLIEEVGSPDFVIARVPARMLPTLTLSIPILRTIRYYLKADISKLSLSDSRVQLSLITMQGKSAKDVAAVNDFAPTLYAEFWKAGTNDFDLGKPDQPERLDFLPVMPLSLDDIQKFEEALNVEIDPSIVAVANWRIQLEGGTPEEREIAASALGLSGNFQAEEALINALKDPVLRVRAAAANALGLLGLPTSIPDLIHLLSDKSPLLRATAARSLGMIGNRRGLDPLEKLAATEKDERVLAVLKKSIDRIKHPTFMLE